MEEDIKARLNAYLTTKSISIYQIAKKTNIPQPTLQKQIKGETAMSVKVLMAVVGMSPDLSVEWLLRGEGGMYKDQQARKTINVYRQGGDGEGQTNVVGEGNDISDKEALMMALKQNQKLIDALLNK